MLVIFTIRFIYFTRENSEPHYEESLVRSRHIRTVSFCIYGIVESLLPINWTRLHRGWWMQAICSGPLWSKNEVPTIRYIRLYRKEQNTLALHTQMDEWLVRNKTLFWILEIFLLYMVIYLLLIFDVLDVNVTFVFISNVPSVILFSLMYYKNVCKK